MVGGFSYKKDGDIIKRTLYRILRRNHRQRNGNGMGALGSPLPKHAYVSETLRPLAWQYTPFPIRNLSKFVENGKYCKKPFLSRISIAFPHISGYTM